MADANFTPGPWLNAGRSAGAHIHSDEGEVAWLRSYMGIPDDKIEANAHLIAAAPELYRKLEAVRKWMDEDDLGPWEAAFCAEIDALLAKARGEIHA